MLNIDVEAIIGKLSFGSIEIESLSYEPLFNKSPIIDSTQL